MAAVALRLSRSRRMGSPSRIRALSPFQGNGGTVAEGPTGWPEAEEEPDCGRDAVARNGPQPWLRARGRTPARSNDGYRGRHRSRRPSTAVVNLRTKPCPQGLPDRDRFHPAAREPRPCHCSMFRFPMPPLVRAVGTRRSQPARNGAPAGPARAPGWRAGRLRQAGSGCSAAQAGPRVPSIRPGRSEPRPAATGSRPPPACSPSLQSSVLFSPGPMGGEPASSSRVTAPEPWPGAAPVGSAPPGATDHA